jgi:hypothetical protein
LILPADENGRHHITAKKEHKEYVMQIWVAHGVKYGKANEANCTDDGKNNG